MSSGDKNFTSVLLNSLLRVKSGIWLFPIIGAIVLILLTIFQVSGSSIGVYDTTLYKKPSSNLLLFKPENIRSDEWIVNTQMTIAQKNNNYNRINKNIGNGEDMSVLLDVPYKDWSEIFKPHNLVFFVLPFNNAFAFKWYVMSYLLVMSCYFFVLALFPKKKFIAIALSLALLFSPFVQWWYLYSAIGSIYYCLFIATAVIHLLRSKRKIASLAWGLLITYLLICFALINYPPFQIPCAIVIGLFLVGYIIEQRRSIPIKELLKKILIIGVGLLVTGIVTLIFIETRLGVVQSIENSSYPGHRITASGSYSFTQLMSGNLDFQLLSANRASLYQLPADGILNQSETSNFLLVLPFLILPAIYLIYKYYRVKHYLDWSLILSTVAFLLFMSWMFIPGLSLLGKLTLLERVPLNRLLIGVGLLNFVYVILVIRRLEALGKKAWKMSGLLLLGYGLIVFVIELLLDLHVRHIFPGFIGKYRVIEFALPIPVIVYALLKRWFKVACLVFVTFTFIMCAAVNPLYKGTAILTNTPLSNAIKKIGDTSNARWVSEQLEFENFPAMNGLPTLNGVYVYPQLGLWKPLNTGNETYIYNRYAHVVINFNRANNPVPTTMALVSSDHFAIESDPCSSYLLNEDVHFAITPLPLNTQSESCIKLLTTVSYPTETFYIYRLH